MGRRAASRPGGPTIFGTRVPIFWIGVHGYERARTEPEKKPDPAEAAAAAKRAAGSTGGDGAGDAGAIKL